VTLIVANSTRISRLADIEDSVRGTKIVIEDGVVVDAFVEIKPAGGSGDVCIEDNSCLSSGTAIYSGNGITIGHSILIAANCTLAPVNQECRSKGKPIVEQRFRPSKGGILTEDDVWIGAGSVVLDGARIRRGAVVAANSVVNGDLESYGIYAGNPGQIIGWRT
jgi:virginiamycin A acetyltransferase